MAKEIKQSSASVGVVEHGNSAVLVTVARGAELLDRRRIDLTQGLPTHPYHHEGSWAVGRYTNSPWASKVSLTDAIDLVERVQAAAVQGAQDHLETLAQDLPCPISAIAIRACPDLPPTIEERIRDNRAQTVADTIMYRKALAEAGEARGWTVVWYNRDGVFEEAAKVIDCDNIKSYLLEMGRAVGPPWQAKHKLAAAAAIAALGD